MRDTFIWMQDVTGTAGASYYYNLTCRTPRPIWGTTAFPRD